MAWKWLFGMNEPEGTAPTAGQLPDHPPPERADAHNRRVRIFV